MAFCTWRRFSAWSNTTECGPSNTDGIYYGRQYCGIGGNFSIYDPSAGKRKQVKEPRKGWKVEDYMAKRRYYEDILRKEFQKKGGMIKRISPHYMVVEQSQWLNDWYENSAHIKIPIKEFDLKSISFTYGDSHPTFSERVQDGKEYRKKLYPYLTADRSVGKIQESNQNKCNL